MTASPQADRITSSIAKKTPGNPPSLFIPFFIVLIVLIISGAREVVTLHKQKMAFITQNQLAAEALAAAAKQADGLKKLQGELHAIAATDPVAAKIEAEYFPSGTSTNPNPSGN